MIKKHRIPGRTADLPEGFPCSNDLSPLSRPLTIGDKTIANRFVYQPMEGCDGTAVGLANMGQESVYITKLPDNTIGDAARNELRRYGVNTDFISRGGDRIGVYFLKREPTQGLPTWFMIAGARRLPPRASMTLISIRHSPVPHGFTSQGLPRRCPPGH
jgi:sugar/nucleoside kinase (ribokinase family)